METEAIESRASLSGLEGVGSGGVGVGGGGGGVGSGVGGGREDNGKIAGLELPVFWMMIALSVVMLALICMWAFLLSAFLRGEELYHLLALRVERMDASLTAISDKMVRSSDTLQEEMESMHQEVESMQEDMGRVKSLMASAPTYAVYPYEDSVSKVEGSVGKEFE
jgi:tetrahydromethanopterin S-methyltransferase subunit B